MSDPDACVSQHPLVEPLGPLLQDAPRTDHRFRPPVVHHPHFKDRRTDPRLLAFSALRFLLLVRGHFPFHLFLPWL
ncbi:hypothetical protein [Verrucomicrobium sp. 3C]|uniref:hypothetical protein n=1 Tax=Verrucomicrobium sp. 3C TaxID=1134055 RepID=UPI00037D8B26|nr:hypothetical protein [Verrucomicrobium sp. 3C]